MVSFFLQLCYHGISTASGGDGVDNSKEIRQIDLDVAKALGVIQTSVDNIKADINEIKPVVSAVLNLSNKHDMLDTRLTKLEGRVESFESRDKISKLTILGWIVAIIVSTVVSTVVIYNMSKIGITKDGAKNGYIDIPAYTYINKRTRNFDNDIFNV